MGADSLLVQVIAAIAVIICVSYIAGHLFRKLRQPEVVGQLIAGIALGPSVLGRYAAPVEHVIFPVKIISYLNVTSQVALIVFLFAVGYELDLGILRHRRGSVPVIAVSTFFFPAILGIGSVYVFDSLYRRAEPHQVMPGFMLFMAVAVSITAVPVLAGVVRERRMSRTIAGVTSLAAAALIDGLGWLVLAGVMLLANLSSTVHRSWWSMVGLFVLYVAAGVFVIRPLLRKLLVTGIPRRPVPGSIERYVPVAAALAMGSAWVTAGLGLHVIFGAFFAGLIMPRRQDGTPDPDLLGPVFQAGGLLLPVFFMVAGLSVNIGVLGGLDLLLLVILLAVAMAGKIGAGFVAGIWTGLSARDSARVGVLLNTRGLTELIALNVGLAAGLIHQRLYTVLVLMALITTMATDPLLRLVECARMPRFGRFRSSPMADSPAAAGSNPL